MKSKTQQQQQPFTSEFDAKEKLIVYVYEYLIHCGAKQAADLFKDSIGYAKDIKVNEGPGFLLDWWIVFWDLYCAAPDRRHSQPESSSDARAFHDYMRQSTPISPSITQTSPTQHLVSQQQPPPPQFITGPRYGPPPHHRGPAPRMQGPPPGHPPPGFMPSSSPRYGQQPQHMNGIPPQQQQHINQVPIGFNPEHMSHSPGLNRMTPVGILPPPPQQQQQIMAQQPHNVGPPQPNQMQIGMQVPQQQQQQQQIGGPQVGQQQIQGPSGPQRNGSQINNGPNGGWQQGNVNYNVNSPYAVGPGSNQPHQQNSGNEPIMMNEGSLLDIKNSPGAVAVNNGGAEPSTPHSQDEYVIPVSFGQDTNDQSESAEILKLKQSMQEDTTKMFEKEQSEFSLGDYSDNPNKWS